MKRYFDWFFISERLGASKPAAAFFDGAFAQLNERRAAPLPDLSDQRVFPGGIQVKALFDPSCTWRLVEEFGEGCYVEQPDGRLLFQWEYTYRDNLLAWLMTFRDQVTLLEPAATRQEITDACRRMRRAYEAMEHGTDT